MKTQEGAALLSLLKKVASAPDSAPSAGPGQVIGRYELVRVLGEGGFGVVHEARDREIHCPVALKLLHPDPDDEARRFERFEREARAMARLNHPNIVTLHDYGEDAGRPYLVLELLTGRTLSEVLLDGPLVPVRALAIGLAIARALAHAHRAGVIHLDLKPSNVFIGEDDHVTVLDFGLARVVPPRSSTSSGTLTTASTSAGLRGAGTPAFMAPEQQRGAGTDARTDVFSAGVLLFAMLTGELPFAIGAAEANRVMRPAEPALRALVPAPPDALVRVVARALSEAPAARFTDGAALLDALRAAELAPVPAPPGRSRLRVGVSAAILTAGAAAGVALAWPTGSSRGQVGAWEIAVPAKQTWLETEIVVRAGQSLTIHATGEVCTKVAEHCAGPEGQPRISDYVLPGLESTGIGTLVGRIGDETFTIGPDRTLRAPAGGALWLGINDRDGTNNTGPGFVVAIDLR